MTDADLLERFAALERRIADLEKRLPVQQIVPEKWMREHGGGNVEGQS